MGIDAVLLIAFGGPEKFEDVRPFLANVLRGRPVPPERVELVVEQYRLIGGRSPMNEITFRQANALESLLKMKGRPLKVFVGMRNWPPMIEATLRKMKAEGIRKAAGIVLAAHRSEASWERYRLAVTEAQQKLSSEGNGAPEIFYPESWHRHPLLIEAIADNVRQSHETAEHWIFTAHSIPVPMDQASNYSGQIRETVESVMRYFPKQKWHLAYQSRSGSPRDPWLEPDVGDKIQELARQGAKSVFVVPVGFLVDHVEVLYDLDIKAKKAAESVGIKFSRAKTVNDHPKFIELLAELVLNIHD